MLEDAALLVCLIKGRVAKAYCVLCTAYSHGMLYPRSRVAAASRMDYAGRRMELDAINPPLSTAVGRWRCKIPRY